MLKEEFLKKYKYLLISLVLLTMMAFTVYNFFRLNKTEEKKGAPVAITSNETENKTISGETAVNTNKINMPLIKAEKPKEPSLPKGTDRFIVGQKETNENIAQNLLDGKYIKNKDSFILLLGAKNNTYAINPGAYKISKKMNDKQLIQVLNGKPYMKWVTIPEGLRKEEIAKILGDTLGWSTKQKDKWIKKDTAVKPEYIEGVYFPDTYLIPVNESTENVANRLISKFNENFSFYLPKFTAQNIKWTTALTLASIAQREAANNADTPLIAGILWNRLNQKMKLDVDATLQYIRGNKGNGWWAPISLEDKKIDSPFNTYMYAGLPPHPISNPGLSAIDAVLNRAQTNCLYYLHDKNHITHCAVTYEEHQANIEKYLKNN